MHPSLGAESVSFRFNAETHEYVDAQGEVLTHITSMLLRTGHIQDEWFTDESCDRGIAVHRLVTDYDLGGLVPEDLAQHEYRGYLLAHVKAMEILRPHWTAVEVPLVHPQYRFGGRPDRVGLLHGQDTILEVKSGAKSRAHSIQTAMQAILAAGQGGLPAEHYQRGALYLTPKGKFRLEVHRDRRDLDEAYRIIRVCCPGR